MVKRLICFFCFFVIGILPSFANENIWHHSQYETANINGGKFLLTLIFEESGVVTGDIVGSGSLSECAVDFKGKGSITNNPLYTRATRIPVRTNLMRTKEWGFLAIENRQNTVIAKFEKFGKHVSLAIYCHTYDDDPFPINIPNILKFHPKS